ncbi:MAG: hypothetical protein AAGK14_01630 [Verrucomicrobiota bacterium]
MAWITITEADVLTVLSGPELAAFRTKATADGQADPLPAVIAQVTDLVRGHVGICGRNRLGAGATIPGKLLAPSLDLIAERLPRRVGLDLTEGRTEAADRAYRVLEAVARCEFAVEAPESASAEQTAGPAPQIHARPPQFQRHDQEGL